MSAERFVVGPRGGAGMFPETAGTGSLEPVQLSRAHVVVFDPYELSGVGNHRIQEVFERVPREATGTVAAADEWLRDAAEWDDRESGRDAVTREGSLLGVAGLAFEWDRRTANLAVMLDRPHWEHGDATGCALALCDLAFGRPDSAVVVLAHEGGNERSRRAIESFADRVGGQYDGVPRNWTRVGDEVGDTHR